MDRRWKVYGILVALIGLLLSSPTNSVNARLSSEPIHSSASLLSMPSSAPAIRDANPFLDRPFLHVAEDPPRKAKDLLEAIQRHQGHPLPGYVGGRVFQNREKRLPPGRYREYDVNPKLRGRSRDAERIVIEQDTGNAYYTGDHYRTFTPLN